MRLVTSNRSRTWTVAAATAALALFGILSGPGPAGAAPARCFGQKVDRVITGSNKTVNGGAREVVFVEGNRITVKATAFSRICAGDGSQTIEAGQGWSFTDGGPGNDRISAAKGDSTVFGGPGDDQIETEKGNNIEVQGGPGDDEIRPGKGNNVKVDGDEGNDRIFLFTQTAKGVVDGGLGNDRIEGSQSHDKLIGGPEKNPRNLPDTDLMLEVVPQGPQSSPVPRIFFVVALLFLLGMLASLAALRRDIVKRQQVQQRLQAEVALRSAMQRSVTIGMRAWDMKGRILYVNDAFCTMVGYAAHELRGASAPLPYWPADQAEEIDALHRSVIRQGTGAEGIEMQFQHRDGHRVDVLIHESPLTAADGTQLGWMSSVLDISERKRAQQLAALQQEKLEASGRLVAVGEVASTLAHELNQPLGALASFANGLVNRLRAGTIGVDEMEPVVQRMAQLAERAGGVIQRVNAFARKRELNLTQVNLSALVRRVCTSVQEAHATPLTLLLPAQDLWVQGDALLLEHLAHNLCSNALAWAPQGREPPQVQVRLAAAPCANEPCNGHHCVALAVADNGPGVPEEARARIFDAFFSTHAGGMGMGLAICRSIIEAHHGAFDAGASPLGGARFSFTIPCPS